VTATRQQARSFLYVPGDRPSVMAAAGRRGADALIFDLEDAVAPFAKSEARENLRQYLVGLADATPVETASRPDIWIRVNPGEAGPQEIAALASPDVTGFCLAKTESSGQVEAAAAACAAAESAYGAPKGTLALMPLLESAAAVLDARPIAMASSRVVALQVGEADLLADLDLVRARDDLQLLHVRSAVVLASAAAGLEPPIGPVDPDFRDLDAFRASTASLRALGYCSRACIHPAQIGIVNRTFSPREDELDRCLSLIARFDEALGQGQGTLTDDDGRMIDVAVVRQARRVVARKRSGSDV